MNKFTYIFAILLISGCNGSEFPPAYDVPCQSPFANLDKSGATQEDHAILHDAADDFCAVVDGKKPIHAKFDNEAPLPADGGTSFYIGNKYSVTVVKSLSRFGSIDGIAYGPIITFDESFAPGNTNVVSNIRFYPFPSDSKSERQHDAPVGRSAGKPAPRP